MKDNDYIYIYQNLLIETKEWHQTIKHLLMYLKGEKPLPAATSKSPAKVANKKSESPKKKRKCKNDEAHKPRCMKLKSTMNARTKFQRYDIMKFTSNQNMCEFLEFMIEHMHFTEKMVYNTIWIGDLVEQSIRYTNLEEFV